MKTHTINTTLNPVEFRILKYVLKHEGETILMKNVANAINITYQTASKYINAHVYNGDIQRDGKFFEIVNPYIRNILTADD